VALLSLVTAILLWGRALLIVTAVVLGMGSLVVLAVSVRSGRRSSLLRRIVVVVVALLRRIVVSLIMLLRWTTVSAGVAVRHIRTEETTSKGWVFSAGGCWLGNDAEGGRLEHKRC
jgi:hypothetical protein